MTAPTVSPVQPHLLREREHRSGGKRTFGDFKMMSTLFTTSLSVTSLRVYLLLVALGLLLFGFALKSNASHVCFPLNPAAAVLLAVPFCLADSWAERGLLAIWSLFALPLLLGEAVIREYPVRLVVKKFSKRGLPPGEFIAGENHTKDSIT